MDLELKGGKYSIARARIRNCLKYQHQLFSLPFERTRIVHRQKFLNFFGVSPLDQPLRQILYNPAQGLRDQPFSYF